jgi:hypothetical protein
MNSFMAVSITMHKLTRILAIITLASMLSACNNGLDSSSSGTTSTHTTQTTTTSSDIVNLNWKAPTTRSDGSYLPTSELAGYRVYMGTSSDNLTELVDLNDDTITNYTINDLSTGNYYFAVSAYDINGLESGYSQVILIQVT